MRLFKPPVRATWFNVSIMNVYKKTMSVIGQGGADGEERILKSSSPNCFSGSYSQIGAYQFYCWSNVYCTMVPTIGASRPTSSYHPNFAFSMIQVLVIRLASPSVSLAVQREIGAQLNFLDPSYPCSPTIARGACLSQYKYIGGIGRTINTPIPKGF
jgi:hypothetical protein